MAGQVVNSGWCMAKLVADKVDWLKRNFSGFLETWRFTFLGWY
jgi:hypothetical protein